jgi:preprotein translocase subunit YajC
MSLIAQTTSQPNAPNSGAGGEQPAEASPWSTLFTFLPMFLAIMFLYLMFTQKPQQRDQKRATEMLSNLKKNDRVVTAGGIVGTVVNINSDQEYITIRIDESTNTKMQVLKQSILRVLNESSSASSEKS